MRTARKPVALHFALAAMLLRALLPLGWMPNPQDAAASPFVICTMNGPAQFGPAKPSHEHDRAGAPCVFASAAPLSTPEQAAAAPLHTPAASIIAFVPAKDVTAKGAVFRPNAARGPPAFA